MRTAPAPNIPAIPGMNPGIFVLGGGGDGGGSGAGAGKGKGGKQGADGKNGGKDAKGGGKNAGACGPGSGGGCPNPSHGNGGTAAGDPVDPISGRVYTVTTIDLALPGTIPLVIGRSYSTSAADTDVGLGYGWSHSLAWRIDVRRRTVRVIAPEAAPTVTLCPDVDGPPAALPVGFLRRHAWGFSLDANGLTYVFAEVTEEACLLSRIHDASGNLIQLFYRAGQLEEVIDSVGRQVRVRRHADGHIAAFEVRNAAAQGRWVSFATYEYDRGGDLTRVRDAEGNTHTFHYDDAHHLVRRTEPGGLTAEHRYDQVGRCVEAFCTRPGNDGLDASVPAVLADGSPAKGFLHVRMEYGEGVTQIITSRSVRRIEGNALDRPDKAEFAGGVHTYAYDASGQLTGYVDALGADWSARRDPHGHLLETVDPLGARITYERDDRGLVVGMCDPLGVSTTYERDAQGRVVAVRDPLGLVVQLEHDRRGLLAGAILPNGGVTRMDYDALANRVRLVEPDGATRTFRHDFFGRVTSFVDERGLETRFTYDDCGRLRSTVTTGGGTERYEYDADGNKRSIVDPDGRVTQLRWGGNHVVTEVIRPDGTVVAYRYDREQDLVRVVNEAGEGHVLTRDVEGRIVAETTFDGRTISYRVDELGRLVQAAEGARKYTFAHDALGRVVERTTSDDRTTRFEYDLLGRMVRAEGPDAACDLTYDARGRLVEETITWGENVRKTRFDYDALGRAIRVAGPGGTVEVVRDPTGRPVEAHIGDVAPLRFRYEPSGWESERALPGGGRICSELTADCLLARRSVLDGSTPPALRPGEPEWLLDRTPGETLRRTYAWSPAGLLAWQGTPPGAPLEVLRDPGGRVAEVRDGARVVRAFGHGPTGDLFEPGVRRAYGAGGRVVACGDATYTYDDLGRVVEKRVAGGAEPQVYSYDWSDDDRLLEVRDAAGLRVSFVYDPFARRLEKRVERRGVPESTTRYAWQGMALVHEIRERARESGDPIVDERSYVHLPGARLPLAQRDGAGGEAGRYLYMVRTPFGGVCALVHGDGRVAEELPQILDSGGAGARLPGQVADEEIGLSYNHFRYHDPLTGCFLTPEPMGLAASLKTYAYGEFRFPEVVDLDGRGSETVIYGPADETGNRPVLARGESGSPGSESTLHPAVVAALPPNPATTNRGDNTPGRCSEPRALSNHLDNYEWNGMAADQRWTPPPPPPRSCRPGDPGWQTNLNGAMSQIDPNDGIVSGRRIGQPNEKRWGACANCGQMIPRLYALAGMPPPGNVCAQGTHTDPATKTTFNQRVFQPTAGGFLTNPANAAYNGTPPPGAPTSLGVWTHDGTGFTGVTPL